MNQAASIKSTHDAEKTINNRHDREQVINPDPQNWRTGFGHILYKYNIILAILN